jgi:hypothetical protein
VPSRPRTRVLVFLGALLLATCAEPPSRELREAREAIAAARAAGAPEFAATAYHAATAALEKAEDAVAAGDYRLALSHALDARDQAVAAARAAASERARVRRDTEATLAEAARRLDQLEVQIKQGRSRRLPARTLARFRASRAAGLERLGAIRAAVEAGDTRAAHQMARDLVRQLDATLHQLDQILRARTPPPRRRRP